VADPASRHAAKAVGEAGMIRSSLSEKLGNAVTEGGNPDAAYGDREPDRR
jgi:hypothetical protein